MKLKFKKQTLEFGKLMATLGKGFSKRFLEQYRQFYLSYNKITKAMPAPIFETPTGFTRSILFSHRKLKNLTKQDRARACYFHASLRYIERDYMTNTSLRERFGIDQKNGAMASRIINDTIQAGLICIYDESVGAKARKYIPTWARS